MRRPARRCRQRRAACARRRPAQRAAARTNHSAAFLTPTTAPAHYRLHPRPHRVVSHSPFAASPPRRAPTTAPAHYRLQPQTHRIVSHSPFAAFPPPTTAHRRSHPRPHRIVLHSPFAASPPPTQRIAALIRAPIAPFRIRPSQLLNRAERPPQPQRITASNRKHIASLRIRSSQLPRRAACALIRNPRHSPPISMPLFEARFAGRIFRLPKNRKSGRDIHPCPQ